MSGDSMQENAGEVLEGAQAGSGPIDGRTTAGSTVDLAAVRELVIKANPDVIPEMITGSTFEELMASVEPARAAYSRIVEQVRGQAPSGAQPPSVPAGGSPGRQTLITNVEQLSPSAKIAEGLKRRKQAGA